VNYAWQAAKLTTLSTISYGYTESASTEPVGPRFLRITDIQADGVDWKSVPFCPIGQAEVAKFRLAHDDIVFARTGATTGKSYLVQDPPEAVFASYLIRLRLRSDQLSPQFLNMYFQTAEYWRFIDAGSTGSAQGGFNARKLGELSIRFPPLDDPRRIVAILDEAFEALATAKANAEKNLQNARELFDGYLERAFLGKEQGWPSKKLGGAFRTLTGSTPSKANAAYFGDFMPLVKPPELVDDVVYDAADGLSPAGASVSRVLSVGSVMVSCIGNLGKIGINSIPVACNQQINAILPDENTAVPEFMFFQALSRPFKKQLAKVASGTTVPIVNKSKFNEIEIVLPPLERQQAMVESFRELRAHSDRLAALFGRKLAALDELKKSLLHQAFSGAL